VRDLLSQARALGVERLDAQLLACHHLGRSRAWLLAHDDLALAPGDGQALRRLLDRRAAGEPLAYITGEREFHGLSLQVSPAVLVPRPDTETLVDWALELLERRLGALGALETPRVLDLGTGSGAIALAIRHGCPRAEVHASDRSAAALDTARRNGHRLGLAVQWHPGAWWDAVPGERFDLVVSNPPYVAPHDSHLAALQHEPPEALVPSDDPGDGLADIRRIVVGARDHLLPGGWLLLEHGADQSEGVSAVLRQAGFDAPSTRPDLAGRPRVTGAGLAAADPV
jgi:release factor glutamine methyltransferase